MLLHLVILLLSRLIAKRPFRVRGKIKWLCIIDLALLQHTHNISYWVGWTSWCIWWDLYDRDMTYMASLAGIIIMCARAQWVIETNIFIYIPAVITGMCMAYVALADGLK